MCECGRLTDAYIRHIQCAKILHGYNYGLLLHSTILHLRLCVFVFFLFMLYNNIIHMKSRIRTCCDWLYRYYYLFIIVAIHSIIIFVSCFFLNLIYTSNKDHSIHIKLQNSLKRIIRSFFFLFVFYFSVRSIFKFNYLNSTILCFSI